MIASLYQNGSTLVGVSPCAMRLTFDAQNAQRNHPFVNCSARLVSSSQNRSGHVAVATFKKNVCVNVHWRVCLGNRWTKWSVQLKRLGGSFACTLLIDYCNFLTFHGTIQTHIYHTPQTKETGARHKIADATVLCHPATRTRSAERLGIDEGDPSGRPRCALSAVRSIQRDFEGAYFASDSQRSGS